MSELNDNILKRIRHLIALSQDGSTTEHERTLALRRAQDLMIKYSISSLGDEVEPQIHSARYDPSSKMHPYFNNNLGNLCRLLQIVGNAFGCQAFMRKSENKVYLMGFPVNIQIAFYTTEVLYTQGRQDLKDASKEAFAGMITNKTTVSGVMGYQINFWVGFLEGLVAKFKKTSEYADEKGVTLYDKVLQEWTAKVTFVTLEIDSSSSGGYSSGFTSARNARVNSAINSTTSNPKGPKLL